MKNIIAILTIWVGAWVAISSADPGSNKSEIFLNQVAEKPSSAHNAIDPFLAGALGFVPYFSGYYITETPERGMVFTLVDVLLTLGIYTSLHSKSGDPDHVPVYYTFMGINNIVDGYFSAHEAMRSSLRPQVKLRPHGGVEYAVAWIF
jgi:hypothetical protein